MNKMPGGMTFLLALITASAFLAAAVKIWSVPGAVLGQLLMLCITLVCILIVCAWLLAKLLGFLRVKGRVKKVANNESS